MLVSHPCQAGFVKTPHWGFAVLAKKRFCLSSKHSFPVFMQAGSSASNLLLIFLAKRQTYTLNPI